MSSQYCKHGCYAAPAQLEHASLLSTLMVVMMNGYIEVLHTAKTLYVTFQEDILSRFIFSFFLNVTLISDYANRI